MSSDQKLLRFGIKTLDLLFGRPLSESDSIGISLGNSPGPTSISITGSAGSGKSILALHLASQYKSDHPDATVIYASTDMSVTKAENYWSDFKLSNRIDRDNDPIDFVVGVRPRATEGQSGSISIHPTPIDELCDVLSATLFGPSDSSISKSEIHLLDLKSTTTGDDWLTLSRLGSLTGGSDWSENRPLLIIDAVEGLLLLGGEKDLFGTVRTRRERIAQLTRVMSESFHLCLVLEDSVADDQLDEEFVVDTTIRIRERLSHDYKQRAIEVPKCRGQRPIRGEHLLVIRGGSGSSTEAFMNPDDPMMRNSYVFVARSVDSRAARMKEFRQDTRDRNTNLLVPNCKFGIGRLDDMLHHEGGLPAGSMTALIGGEGTHKARLGRAFLAEGILESGTGVLLSFQRLPGIAELLQAHVGGAQSPEEGQRLRAFTSEWEPGTEVKHVPSQAKTLVYRRFAEQGTSAPMLCHIVEACVLQALTNLIDADTALSAEQKASRRAHLDAFPNQTLVNAGKVRIVIEDLSVLRLIYPDIDENRMFLAFLVQFLRLAGVTALFIDTQNASPSEIVRDEIDRNLRALVDHQLFTWPVQFGGEGRVAISAIPPISDQVRAKVRELKGDSAAKRERLDVDEHFELYKLLDKAEPELTPLVVYLIGDTDGMSDYRDDLAWVLQCSTGNLASENSPIKIIPFRDYERTLGMLHMIPHGLALKETAILQLDEWWINGPTMLEGGRDGSSWKKRKIEDLLMPLSLSNIGAMDQQSDDWTNRFDEEIVDLPHCYGKTKESPVMAFEKTFLVPHFWNFGFILVNARLWERAKKSKRFGDERGSHKLRQRRTAARGLQAIESIVSELSEFQGEDPETRPGEPPSEKKHKASARTEYVSWTSFLSACGFLSEFERGYTSSEQIPPFEIDLSAVENLNVFILEVWLSVLAELMCTANRKELLSDGFDRSKNYDFDDLKGEALQINKILADSGREGGLIGLIGGIAPREKGFETLGSLALYLTLLSIAEVVDVKQIPSIDFGLDLGTSTASNRAAATRHWYSTILDYSKKFDPENPLVPLQLPGLFATRGDWYLAALKESRSEYLAKLSIKSLSSHRGARMRLQSGIGLPVVELSDSSNAISSSSDNASTFGLSGLRSAIPRSHRGRQSLVPYAYLKSIGPLEKNWESEEFRVLPLWRSRICNYDYEHRAFRKWCYRNLVILDQIRDSMKRRWIWFEDVYDAVEDHLVSREGTLGERVQPGTLIDWSKIHVRRHGVGSESDIDTASNEMDDNSLRGTRELSEFVSVKECVVPLLELLRLEISEIRKRIQPEAAEPGVAETSDGDTSR